MTTATNMNGGVSLLHSFNWKVRTMPKRNMKLLIRILAICVLYQIFVVVGEKTTVFLNSKQISNDKTIVALEQRLTELVGDKQRLEERADGTENQLEKLKVDIKNGLERAMVAKQHDKEEEKQLEALKIVQENNKIEMDKLRLELEGIKERANIAEDNDKEVGAGDDVSGNDGEGVETANVTIPHLRDTWWKDLDLSYNVTCGGFKCFIKSASNNNIGYLISRDVKIFDDMNKSTAVAKEIQSKYGAKHLLIEPPFLTSIPAQKMAQVNSIAQQPLKKRNHKSDFFSKPSVIVQKVKTAPEPYLFFACYNPNHRITQKKLPGFMLLLTKLGSNNTEKFKTNIDKERKVLRKMLNDKPGQGADLQALISTDGEFFYIDIDATVYWSKRKFTHDRSLNLCEKAFDVINDALKGNKTGY